MLPRLIRSVFSSPSGTPLIIRTSRDPYIAFTSGQWMTEVNVYYLPFYRDELKLNPYSARVVRTFRKPRRRLLLYKHQNWGLLIPLTGSSGSPARQTLTSPSLWRARGLQMAVRAPSPSSLFPFTFRYSLRQRAAVQ